jgi:hypothetical protein
MSGSVYLVVGRIVFSKGREKAYYIKVIHQQKGGVIHDTRNIWRRRFYRDYTLEDQPLQGYYLYQNKCKVIDIDEDPIGGHYDSESEQSRSSSSSIKDWENQITSEQIFTFDLNDPYLMMKNIDREDSQPQKPNTPFYHVDQFLRNYTKNIQGKVYLKSISTTANPIPKRSSSNKIISGSPPPSRSWLFCCFGNKTIHQVHSSIYQHNPSYVSPSVSCGEDLMREVFLRDHYAIDTVMFILQVMKSAGFYICDFETNNQHLEEQLDVYLSVAGKEGISLQESWI